ncbi:hypothetical protein BALOs_2227 [Halobacteriovorax sp. BALOs_7]|nr:hypothetical protein BALOs_2227 [Halobacteriovorax sp. BALOs_7]
MNKYINTLKLRNFFAFLAISLLISSCGFINDDPVDGADIAEYDGISASCKIDTDRIKKIFEVNIEKELNCVQDTLNKFKYVESRDKRFFFREDIVRFARKYMNNPPGSADDIIEGLDLLFKLNSLLQRDIPGQMSRSKIDSFFAILKEINRSGVKIVDTVKEMQKVETLKEYEKLSAQMRQQSNVLADNINVILRDIPGPAQAIDIQDLILDITKDLKDFKLGKEVINSLLFAKKLFLGGSRIYIDSDEFAQLFTFLPVFLENIADIFFLKKEYYKDGSAYFNELANNIEELKLYVYEHQKEENIITIDDINNIIDEFFTSDDIISKILGTNEETNRKLKALLRYAKRDLIRGNPEVFSYSDVELALSLINVGIRSFESVNILTDLVKEIEDKDFDRKVVIKKEFRAEIGKLSTNAKKLLNEDITIPRDHQMNILQFADDIIELYELDIRDDFTNSLLALKVLTTGGTREVLQLPELLTILSKTDPLAALFFDLMYLSKDYIEKTSLEKNNFFLAQVRSVQDLLLDELDSDNVITVTDINNIIEQFFKKPEDLEKGIALKNLVGNYKDNILRLPPSVEHLSFKELKSTVNVVAIVYRYLAFLDFHIENVEIFKKMKDGEETTRSLVSKKDYVNRFLSIKAELSNYLLNKDFVNQDGLIKSLILRLEESQALFKKEFNTALYSQAMSLKGLVLGGNNLIINRDDLYHLTEMSEGLAEVLYDAFFTDFSIESDSVQNTATALKLIRKVKSILHPVTEKRDFFSAKDILSFANEVLLEINRRKDKPKDEADLINMNNFKRTLIEFTQRVFDPVPRSELMYPIPCKPNPAYDPDKQGSSKWICSELDPPGSENFDLMISSDAIDRIFEIIDGAIEAQLFSDATFRFFSDRMQSPDPVYIDQREFPTELEVPEYKLITKKSYVILTEEFAKVARDFRYFRNKDGFPTYQAQIVRNKTGFNSIMLFRNVLPYVLEGYAVEGDTTNPRVSKGLRDNQLNNALVGLKAALEEMGLWTDDFKTFGENILLLSDLFQATSGGDLYINLDEVSEFIELIFTAAKMTSLLEDNLYAENECSHRVDENGFKVMESKCIRTKFFDKLFGENEENLSKYFPRLKEYVDANSREHIVQFIEGVEVFSRSVEDIDKVWWRTKDFTLVIGAMLNIESTYIRFDKNADNKLDQGDLDRGYEQAYKNAIISIAKLKGKLKTFGRTAFFYLLKYHKDPGAINVAWTHIWFKKYFKKFKAKRLDISELLKFLVDKRKPEDPSIMFKEELAACALGRTDVDEDELNEIFKGMSTDMLVEQIRQCHADYVQSDESEAFYGNFY